VDARTIEGLVLSVVWIVAAVRRRQLSVDAIALLALAGALWVNEPFAGAMITAMLISGQLLEARARDDNTTLIIGRVCLRAVQAVVHLSAT
jgi:hypothetical protein